MHNAMTTTTQKEDILFDDISVAVRNHAPQSVRHCTTQAAASLLGVCTVWPNGMTGARRKHHQIQYYEKQALPNTGGIRVHKRYRQMILLRVIELAPRTNSF